MTADGTVYVSVQIDVPVPQARVLCRASRKAVRCSLHGQVSFETVKCRWKHAGILEISAFIFKTILGLPSF